MAEEITSTLGLDAEKMFQELARMQRELSGYSNAIDLSASSMTAFNRVGAQTDAAAAKVASSLAQIERAASSAGNELRSLTPAAQNFANIIKSQENASKSLTGQLQEAAALARSLGQVSAARELDARAANLQAQATLKATLQEKANQRAIEAKLQRGRDPLNVTTPRQGVIGAEFRAADFFREQEKVVQAQATLRTNLRATEEAIRKTFRGDAVRKLGDDLQATGDKGAAAGTKIFLSWESVVRIFTIQVLHRIVAQLSSALIEGTDAAKEFSIAIGEIQTVSRDLNLSFDELSAKTIQVSRDFGSPLEIVTEGLYETLSNQVGAAAEAFDFLTTSQRFGIAAVTDTDSAVNLLSSVINSYNLSVAEADTVSGKLFKTIELGRIRGEEFANTFGRVAVVSAQLGIELDEVLAAIATLTVQGLKYNEAFTLITNTEQKLINPSEALQRVFKDMGVASAEAGIQAFGFQGFLEKLTDESGDTATEIGKLFNRIRAIRGVLGLTNRQGERFNEVLQQIQAAGAPELEQAFETIFQTTGKQFEKQLNDIQLLFTQTFGGAILTSLNKLFNVFGGGTATVQAFGLAAAAAGTAYVIASTGIVASTASIIASFTTLGGAIAAIRVALIGLSGFIFTPAGAALAIAAATLAAVAAYNRFAPAIEDVTEALKKQNDVEAETILNQERLRRAETNKTQKELLSQTQKFLFERQQLFQKDAEAARQLQETVFGDIADQIKSRIGIVSSFADGLDDTFNKARKSAHDLRLELEGIGNDLDAFNFERRIQNLAPQQQALEGIRRSQEQIGALNQALARGDITRAETLQRIAAESAKAALSAADETKNRALIRQAEENVRDTFRAQADIKQKQIQQNEKEVTTAARLRDQEQARVVRLNELFNQFKEFEAISKQLVVDPKFDPAQAQKELDKISQQITAELQGAAASAELIAKVNVDFDFENVVNQIREKFRQPVTGARIDLTPLIDVSLNQIVDTLGKQAAALTEAQRDALKGFGITVGLGGFADAQNALPKIAEDLKVAQRASDDLTLSQATSKNQLVDVTTEASNLATVINRISDRGNVVNALFGDSQGTLATLVDGVKKVTSEILTGGTFRDAQNPLASQIAEQVIAFNRALADNNAVAAQTNINNILQIANGLRAEFPQLAAQADELVGKLNAVITTKGRMEELGTAAETLTPLQERVQASSGLFSTVSDEAIRVGASTRQGVNAALTAETQQQNAINRTIELLREKNRVASQGAGGGIQLAPGRAFGGFVLDTGVLHRAFGGGVRGTDRLLTSLTPGEGVIDASAMRRFFPQVQAMNAGVQPVFRESGGIVNNVGDIHVTVNEAKNGRVTGREVTRALNRELRKRTSNLKGL